MIQVDRIYVINNMALAFFINNYRKNEMFVKGVSGKSGFVFIVLGIGIAYWPLLFPCGGHISIIPDSVNTSPSGRGGKYAVLRSQFTWLPTDLAPL